MSKLIKVKFIIDGFVNGSLIFKKGESHELEVSSAYRWIKRGIAEEVLHIEEKEKEEVLVEVEEVLEAIEEEVVEEKKSKGKKSKK